METNYLFQIIMKYTKDSIIITDHKGNLEIFNNYTRRLWKYSENELKGINVSTLFEFGNIGIDDSKVNSVKEMLSMKNWSGEIYAANKESNLLYLRVSVYPILDENSNVKNYFIISENIKEKKELLDQLQMKEEELSENIESLKNAQAMMIEEDKLANLGHLSAGIAHEINNPLGFIISNFGTLKKYIEKINDILSLYKNLVSHSNEEVLSKEELEKIKIAEKEYNLDFLIDDISELFKDTEDGIERVQKIILAMRNFAHSSVEKNFEQYDLNHGITNTLVIARNEIKYNADIETELNELPVIEAIPSEINQVILNIIINASHAIKEKQEKIDPNYFGLLKITTFTDDSFVNCVIEDNGTGIPKENLNKIFEPFFTTKPIGKGTGLGLSIAYNIIKNKHNGDLNVESTLGEGTKIVIRLPIQH